MILRLSLPWSAPAPLAVLSMSVTRLVTSSTDSDRKSGFITATGKEGRKGVIRGILDRKSTESGFQKTAVKEEDRGRKGTESSFQKLKGRRGR